MKNSKIYLHLKIIQKLYLPFCQMPEKYKIVYAEILLTKFNYSVIHSAILLNVMKA